MAGQTLQLPTIQNWSCHNCSGCCRQHAIDVSEEERRRIEKQNWTSADGIDEDQPLFVPSGGPPWKKRYRLAHQSDGACVFLDENGLCKIHAKFGEQAKPLACRIYPYAFHPSGSQVTVSLRFSCPSVVKNQGRAVSENRSELKKIARSVIPENAGETPPPYLSRKTRLDWPDTLSFVHHLDQTFADEDVSITDRLLRALCWIKLVDQARFDNVRGERLEEFLEIVREAAEADIAQQTDEPGPPSKVGQMHFRLLAAQYARKDTQADLADGWKGRWRLLRAALQFARGKGQIPPLQEGFREVPFAQLEQPFGGVPSEVEEIFTRYFRVKIQGLHFCGPAYYDLPLVEGFYSLALIYPTMLWIARWLAASEERSSLQLDDVTRAVAIADHHHGYSPAFGTGGFRRRVRSLDRLEDISKLCQWYSR